MRCVLVLLSIFAGSVFASGTSTTVVAQGSSDGCRRNEKEAIYWAHIDANLNATALCDKFGENWQLEARWELPDSEKPGNPIERASCTPCTNPNVIPPKGIKCTVIMFPQTCRDRNDPSNRDPLVSNADWGAKIGSAGVHVPNGCVALVKYRDTTLVNDFDSAVKRYLTLHKGQSLEFINQLKAESQAARKRSAVITDVYKLTLALKTTSQAIGDIVKVDPVSGAVIEGAMSAGDWTSRVLRTGKAISTAKTLSPDEVYTWTLNHAASKVPGIGPALQAAYNLSSNIIELHKVDKDGRNALDVLDKSIAQLEKSIRKFEAKMEESEFRLQWINAYKNAIDLECNRRT